MTLFHLLFLFLPLAPENPAGSAATSRFVPVPAVANHHYRATEVWAPVTIRIKDETEVPTLWCKTKIMTSVFLPLAQDDFIMEILTGDDEKLWQTGGTGSRFFSVKPAHTAAETTALVRCHGGQTFQFRLFNLTVPPPDDVVLASQEEQEAYRDYFNRMQGFDPYIAVVLQLRDAKLPSREDVLAEKEAKLDAAIAEYRQLNESLTEREAAIEAETETSCQMDRQTWLRDYAGLVDAGYRVKYRWFRGYKKRFPVKRVFNDGVFTWVEIGTPRVLTVYEKRPDGSYEVVNARFEGGLYRIGRVAEVLEFRDGNRNGWVLRLKRRTP